MSDTIVVDRLEILKLLKDLNTTKSVVSPSERFACLIDQSVFLVNLSFRTGKLSN